MKRIVLLMTALLLMCSAASAQSILGRLGRTVRNAAEESINRQVEKTVSDAVDAEFDKAREKQRKKAEEAAAETQRQLDSLAEAGVEIEVDADEVKEEPAAKEEPAKVMPANAEYAAYAKSHGIWFCDKPGAKLHYVQKDADGRQTNEVYYTIKDVKKEGAKTVVSYDMLIPALGGDPIGCSVRSEGGWFYADPRSVTGQVGKNMNIKGNTPIMPERPSAGLKLEDCTVTIESMSTTANYTNIRFTKNEQITTDAGTFDCWCLEYTTVSKMAFIKATTQNEQWFAKGVGVVKYVMKDKNGNIQSIQELDKIEK